MPIKPITTMVNTYIFIMINDIAMISYFLTYPRLPDPPIMARRQGGGEEPASYQGDHDGAKVVVMAPRWSWWYQGGGDRRCFTFDEEEKSESIFITIMCAISMHGIQHLLINPDYPLL